MRENEPAADADLREATAGFLVLTVASTVAALVGVAPTAVYVIGIAGLVLGILLWMVLVEQRAPWPIGPEVPRRKPWWPDAVGLLLAMLTLGTGRWPTEIYFPASSGLGSPSNYQDLNVVLVPAHAAMTLIASLAVGLTVPLVIRLALLARDRTAARSTGASSPLSSGTASK